MEDLVRVDDFLGNGGREVVVVAPFWAGPNPGDGSLMEVDCFSSRGALLWSYVPHDTITFGNQELKGPWSIYDLMVSHEGGKRWIWVLAVHQHWGNSFVVQIDPETGHGQGRFVNTGVLYALNELRTARGTILLVGGFNNEYEAGSLAVVDESSAFAASPQTAGTIHKCTSCPGGDPNYYFVFPRSEINVLRKEWLDAVGAIVANGDGIQISKYELSRSGAQTLYSFRLEPVVRAASLRFSSPYVMEHRERERSHQLDHSLAECPERKHPKPIRMWSRSAGWEELPVSAVAP